MLQAILTVHNWSVIYPLQYWSFVFMLFLAFTQVCYVLGGMNAIAAIASSTPTPTTPTRRRTVFVKRNNAVLVLLGNLIFLGKIESQLDTLAITLAVKVT